MGHPKAFRDLQAIKSELERAGDQAKVKAALYAIQSGPPKATNLQFAALLGKLALHYYRPDFTPEQAKHHFADFVHDLDGVTAVELSDACKAWRTNGDNRFFPTPGQLLALVRGDLVERHREKAGAQFLLDVLNGNLADEPPITIRRALEMREALGGFPTCKRP
jgi:hypothetical protein